ncbi:hypothetical protein Fcan01_14477 [Folsomia candida]|uniref:CHK kinase-like domain-containing protein n=1 Tax=Folsomia candida TaxID=158441 RepID=A0A226E1Z1_FOLCA|nr:hypothetical protein Fcan01_14477 [Folsomia candida]
MSPTHEQMNSSTSPTDLPTTNCNDLITQEFLQNALKMEANGGSAPEIVSYLATPGSKPGDNYASIIYSVDINLSDGTKRHLLIKCYPNHPSRQELTNKMNLFFKECEVYSKWMPELRRMQKEVFGLDKEDAVKLPYAKFVHGECIDFQSEEGDARKSGPISSLDNYIIMEDLRKTHGFRMTSRLEPLDFDHMKLVISALARVHSVSWAYRNHVEENITQKFPCLVTNMPDEEVAIFSNVVRSNLEQAKGIYDKEFGPKNAYTAVADKFSGMIDRISSLFTGSGTAEGFEKLMRVKTSDKFGRDAENPATGKPLEVILLDLQKPLEACVVNDLQNLIYLCTTLEFRRKYLDDLLQLYHDTFNGVCEKLRTPTLPGFCMDSLRFRYHRAKFFGYYMAMMGIPIILKEEVANMEDMGDDKNLTDAFTEICSGAGTNNTVKERLIEVTREMMEDGIF